MAEDTPVEQSRNGTNAGIVFAKDITIIDLWHIARGIANGACKDWSEEERKEISEEILNVWVLAHDMKSHIIDKE